MPIRPELRHHYQGEMWENVRSGILQRAGECCEWCRRPDRTAVDVGPRGEWRIPDAEEWRNQVGFPVPAPPLPWRRVLTVLTVAHLDHQPANNDPRNLAALCQRCHITHDAPHHWATRRQKARAANLELDLRLPGGQTI